MFNLQPAMNINGVIMAFFSVLMHFINFVGGDGKKSDAGAVVAESRGIVGINNIFLRPAEAAAS